MPPKKKYRNPIVREVEPQSNIGEIAKAVASVLGTDRTHNVSTTERGEPRLFVPSGIPDLDLVLDREGRGWPVGRIVEVYGAEACIPADTYLFTNRGLLTLQELYGLHGFKATCRSRVEKCEAWLLNRHDKMEKTSEFWWNNKRPVFAVKTEDGAEIKATANHPHLVLDEIGYLVWRKVSEIKAGDYLVRSRVGSFGGVRTPTKTAYLLGVLVADGYFGRNKVAVTNDDSVVISVLRSDARRELGVKAVEYQVATASIDFQFSSVSGIRAFYSKWELQRGVARDKCIPKKIRMGTRGSVRAFIRGYMDCEASYDGAGVAVSSASHLLLRQVKLLLQSFGVHSTIVETPVDGVMYWRLHITGADARRYLRRIGTRSRSWKAKGEFGHNTGRQLPVQVLPLVKSLYAATETTRVHHKAVHEIISCKTRSSGALEYALRSLEWGNKRLRQHLLELCQYEFVKVIEVAPCGRAPTFDVRLPGTHSFVAEGFITHNTAKTGFGYALIGQAQKMGGDAVLYPAEGCWDEWLAERYGIQMGKLILGDDPTVEGIFTSFNRAMNAVGRKGLLIGMIDSVAGMTTRDELDALEAGEPIKRDRAAQIRALMLSAALRKMGAAIPRVNALLFCVNQVRENPDAMFDKKLQPPGGRALRFYASIRLRLEILGKYTRTRKGVPYVAGLKLKVTAEKNKQARPFQEARILLDYDRGILPIPKKKQKKLKQR